MKYPKTTHPQTLKNYECAIIEEAKLVGYSLNPAHPVGGHKARVFQSALGFNQENWQKLESEIRMKLPYHPATKLDETSFGTKFSVYLPITGPNLRTVEVLTVWQYDKDIEGNEPNFSF
jgi:hypothetical protein